MKIEKMKFDKAVAGRPKVKIDWEKVTEHLRAGCNGVAVSRLLGCDPETLYSRCKEDNNIGFSDFLGQKRAEGVALMEKAIYDNAIKSGGADRIFWLKNRAGWKDKTDIGLETQLSEADLDYIIDKILNTDGKEKID